MERSPAERRRLNLGCGPIQPADWVNVDGSRRAWLASHLPFVDALLVRWRLLPPTEFGPRTFYADLNRRFPWDPDSVDAIFMGELLEHFTKEHGRRLLEECFRVLRPGGRIRVRVPDNADFWRNYLREYDHQRSLPISQRTHRQESRIALFFNEICVRPNCLTSMGHYHKWVYDDVSLHHLLSEVGFVGISRRKIHDSEIPGIADVERSELLTMEAGKPCSQ